ncbi:MAG: hypothetical protein ACON5A_02765 [Candidatus Comchoanobacterales bacterium]
MKKIAHSSIPIYEKTLQQLIKQQQEDERDRDKHAAGISGNKIPSLEKFTLIPSSGLNNMCACFTIAEYLIQYEYYDDNKSPVGQAWTRLVDQYVTYNAAFNIDLNAPLLWDLLGKLNPEEKQIMLGWLVKLIFCYDAFEQDDGLTFLDQAVQLYDDHIFRWASDALYINVELLVHTTKLDGSEQYSRTHHSPDKKSDSVPPTMWVFLNAFTGGQHQSYYHIDSSQKEHNILITNEILEKCKKAAKTKLSLMDVLQFVSKEKSFETKAQSQFNYTSYIEKRIWDRQKGDFKTPNNAKLEDQLESVQTFIHDYATREQTQTKLYLMDINAFWSKLTTLYNSKVVCQKLSQYGSSALLWPVWHKETGWTQLRDLLLNTTITINQLKEVSNSDEAIYRLVDPSKPDMPSSGHYELLLPQEPKKVTHTAVIDYLPQSWNDFCSVVKGDSEPSRLPVYSRRNSTHLVTLVKQLGERIDLLKDDVNQYVAEDSFVSQVCDPIVSAYNKLYDLANHLATNPYDQDQKKTFDDELKSLKDFIGSMLNDPSNPTYQFLNEMDSTHQILTNILLIITGIGAVALLIDVAINHQQTICKWTTYKRSIMNQFNEELEKIGFDQESINSPRP